MFKLPNPFHKPIRWFTSDLHFGHKNVITYCDRPWATVEEMNEALIKIWNDTVHPKDTVYCLGDLSMSPRVMEEISAKLNGHKILVAGNHDRCFAWNGKPRTRELIRYSAAGWEVHQTLDLELKDGTNILLSHLPYHDPETKQHDVRYLEYRPQDKGQFLLHGHQHAKYLKAGRKIDVGIDNNFSLYNEDYIIKLIKDNEDFIPSRLTGKVVSKHGDPKETEGN